MKYAIRFPVKFHAGMFSNPSRRYVSSPNFSPDWLRDLTCRQSNHPFRHTVPSCVWGYCPGQLINAIRKIGANGADRNAILFSDK